MRPMANKRIKSLRKALAITYADDYCDRDEHEVLYQLEQQGYTVKKIVPSYKEYGNSQLLCPEYKHSNHPPYHPLDILGGDDNE